ncbi:hypothetical protein HZC53_03625 [Candidatus Uhrbacteria bacterium]|nr:hypothetical protein [Candidatus Uhrbacteria bacterium]
MTKGGKILVGLALVGIGAAGRLLPHAWNFTPLIALTLVAGRYLGRKHAIWIAMAAMLVGDFWLGFYDEKLMLVVYSSLAVVGLASKLLDGKIQAWKTLAVSTGCSFFFFLATNWAVWQFSVWYPKTLSGLLECFTAGLPFFRNALFGDLFYTAFFFSAIEFGLALDKIYQAKGRKPAHSVIQT